MFFLQEPLKDKCYFLIPDDQWKDTVRLAERNNCSIIFKNANDFGVLEEFTSFIQPLRFIISFLDQAPVPRDTSEYFCLNSNSLLTCISFKCAHRIYQSTIVCSDSCHQELNHLFRKSCVCVLGGRILTINCIYSRKQVTLKPAVSRRVQNFAFIYV